MNDKLFSGALAGLIGSGVVAVISYIFKGIGWYHYTYVDLAASLIYPYEKIHTLEWHLMGWLNNFIIGIILGVLLAYVLYFTGKDYGLLKGGIIGLVWWFFLTVVIQPEIFHWGRFTQTQYLLANLFRDILFGIIASFILIKYARLKQIIE